MYEKWTALSDVNGSLICWQIFLYLVLVYVIFLVYNKDVSYLFIESALGQRGAVRSNHASRVDLQQWEDERLDR